MKVDKKEFSGIDVDLDISLYEYGLIWEETKKDEYLFYYGVEHNENEFTLFDYAYMSKKEFEDLLDEDWIDTTGLESFSGMNKEELIESFPRNLDIVISYYGYENVFGSSYYPFTIDK